MNTDAEGRMAMVDLLCQFKDQVRTYRSMYVPSSFVHQSETLLFVGYDPFLLIYLFLEVYNNGCNKSCIYSFLWLVLFNSFKSCLCFVSRL